MCQSETNSLHKAMTWAGQNVNGLITVTDCGFVYVRVTHGVYKAMVAVLLCI